PARQARNRDQPHGRGASTGYRCRRACPFGRPENRRRGHHPLLPLPGLQDLLLGSPGRIVRQLTWSAGRPAAWRESQRGRPFLMGQVSAGALSTGATAALRKGYRVDRRPSCSAASDLGPIGERETGLEPATLSLEG